MWICIDNVDMYNSGCVYIFTIYLCIYMNIVCIWKIMCIYRFTAWSHCFCKWFVGDRKEYGLGTLNLAQGFCSANHYLFFLKWCQRSVRLPFFRRSWCPIQGDSRLFRFEWGGESIAAISQVCTHSRQLPEARRGRSCLEAREVKEERSTAWRQIRLIPGAKWWGQVFAVYFLGGSMCCAKRPLWEIGIACCWCLSLVWPFVFRARM